MDFQFIDNVRLQLESNNIFLYGIQGAKICAISLLFFSVLERWGKSLVNNNSNVINDILTITGYLFLISSSNFIFDKIEDTFSSISSEMSNVDDNLYSNMMMMLDEDYQMLMEGAEEWYEMIGVVFSSFSFFTGYTLLMVLMGICKVAEMSMICGYLLTRVFLLAVLKFLFPIVVALSTLKQTSGLLGKWLRMYIGLALLGIIYIGIIQMCIITQEALHGAFTSETTSGFFSAYMNMSFSIWGAFITIVVVFTLKVSLFAKATSFMNNFFS